jgi:hypothetical protein
MAKRWGRGWEVSVNKNLHEQEKVQLQAAKLLETECGVRHEKGSRDDLCPSCIKSKRETKS